MTDDAVLLETRDRVAWITLNHPAAVWIAAGGVLGGAPYDARSVDEPRSGKNVEPLTVPAAG